MYMIIYVTITFSKKEACSFTYQTYDLHQYWKF